MRAFALLVVSMLLVGSLAMAFEQPDVTSPREGATLGPNYDVIGMMPYRAFLVVMTDVINCDNDETIASVPGIRHWTNNDGSFHFRVASPRISFGGKDMSIAYRVRVFEASPESENMGEEASINVECIPNERGASFVAPVGRQATNGIQVSMPEEGEALGPNYDIVGRAPGRMLLVVMTDVVDADTGEVIRSVPGIRHWTNADGSFRFRAASPRISIGEKERNLSYRVRVFEVSPGETGPETTINVGRAE